MVHYKGVAEKEKLLGVVPQELWACSQDGCYPRLQAINAGEGVEEREPSYTVGENANYYSRYGEQCGDSLKNWK